MLSREKHNSAVDTIPGCAWSASPDGSLESLNAAWREYLGDAAETGSNVWLQALHPHDKRHFLDFWSTLLSARRPGQVEARLRRHDGMFRWFVVRVVPLCDAGGKVEKWYGQNTDVEDQKRAESTLAGEKALLEMVATGDALPVILDALCSLVTSIAEGCVCSVLLADPHTGVVRHAAAPGVPLTLTQSIDGQRFTAPHWGPCARAVDDNAQVIVSDIAADPSWQDSAWSQHCLAAGFRACWTTPIRSRAGIPLGTFALYQREPGGPTPLQLSLIERFTHVASIAVERSLNEAALKRSEAQLARAQRLSAPVASAFARTACSSACPRKRTACAASIRRSPSRPRPCAIASIQTTCRCFAACSPRPIGSSTSSAGYGWTRAKYVTSM